MTILDPLTGRTVSIDRPPCNPRRAYDAEGREIPPMTLGNMREHGVRGPSPRTVRKSAADRRGRSMSITCLTTSRCPTWRCAYAARPAARGT